jgi:sRNA-binding carbon storage regulator CsrA
MLCPRRMEAYLLVLSRKKDEEIILKVGEETIRISLVKIESHRARIGIDASQNVVILRGELLDSTEKLTD